LEIAMSELPTGTVTFLFTDVEGSTSAWERAPEAMSVALTRLAVLVDTIVTAHAGVVVLARGEGDSHFVVFARAKDAAGAAVALQRTLRAEPWPAATPLRVRLALHTGEAELRDGSYYGTAVNRCARLRAIAHGGQVLLSQTTRDLVCLALPEETTLRDLGEQRLPDLTAPERVYQLVVPGVAEEFPPLNSLGGPPNNLPIQVTSFVGRERELAAVKARLGEAHLLTLTGPGGSGKTRLALRAAADVLDTYPDGAWLIDLAPLSDPTLVPQIIANVLGLQPQSGTPPLAVLTAFLGPRTILLILDNSEHLIDACATVASALIQTCPRLRVLATSREPLGIAGEIIWRVPSLSVLDLEKVETGTVDLVALVGQSEAGRLFVDRAVAVTPGFTLTEQNARSVAQICQQLDGMPLAIELAAARIAVLAVQQIAARLDQRFRLLITGSRTARRRQQTLQATIDWSYNLLTEREREMFRRLSVFAGGFCFDAVEAVCQDAGDVLDLLSNLVNKSLVVADGGANGVERYRLLETLRQYGAERLDAAGESVSTRARHLTWCVDLGETAESLLYGPEQAQWLERLAREHDNFRAALAWSVEHDPEAGLRLAGSIWRFWQVRGYVVEGGRHLAALLDRACEPTVARAKALLGAAILAIFQTDVLRRRALSDESLAIFRQLDDKRGIAWALENLGLLMSDSGDPVTGRVWLEEALTLAREVGESWRTGWVVATLAGSVQVEGDLQRARELNEESLAIFRKVGEKRGIGGALTQLANLALLSKDYDASYARLVEAMAVYRDIGDQRGIGRALRGLGNVHHFRGKRHLAATHYEESLTILRKVGAARNLGDTLLWLGNLALGEGDDRRANVCLREALEIFHAARDVHSVSVCLGMLAIAAMHQAAFGRAIRLAAAVPAIEKYRRGSLILIQYTGVDVGLEEARSALIDEDYATARAEGQKMTLDQAVTYALSDDSPAE
jgi:predicted ATPase/class 3 adenylate cyclase